MNKKIIIGGAIALLALLAILAGLLPPRENRAETTPLVGVAFPENYIPRWHRDIAALQSALQKLNYRSAAAIADSAQDLQNQQIMAMLEQNIDFLVLCNVDETVRAPLAVARQKNVPVLCYDRLITNTADIDYYLTFDNYTVGALQGKALADALDLENTSPDLPKHLVLFAGSIADNNSRFVFDGAMSVLRKYIESGAVKIIGAAPKNSVDPDFEKITVMRWDPINANLRMTEILQNEAKEILIDGILAPNDGTANGIREACLGDERYVEKVPLITGQDADVVAMLAVKSGQQLMTVFKDTRQLADAAAQIVAAILQGKEPHIPNVRKATGESLAMGDTGVKTATTYLLEPIAITRANFQVPLTAGFYSAEETELLNAQSTSGTNDEFVP